MKVDEGSGRRVRRLILALAAVAGVVAAHGLEYSAAHLDPAGRGHHLHATGHGYWPGAVRLAVAAAVLAMGIAAGYGLRRASDRRDTGGETAVGARGPLLRLRPLMVAQLGLFASMEVAERVVAGAGLSDLIRTPWFAVGLGLQALVAAAAVLVLRLIAAGAERVATAVRRRRRRVTAAGWPAGVSWMPAAVVATTAGCRGPPYLLPV